MLVPVFMIYKVIGNNNVSIILSCVWGTLSMTSFIITWFSGFDSIGELIFGLFSNLLYIINM